MIDEHTYRHKGNTCPLCFKLIDAATNIETKRAPEPGDVTICVYCSSWLIFNDDMTLRAASRQDIDDLPKDFVYRLIQATKALEEFNRLYGKP